MHHTTGRNRTIASALGILAAILLFVSLALSWYDTTFTASGTVEGVTISSSGTVSFHLGNSYTSPTFGAGGSSGSQTLQYSNSSAGPHLNKTGALYETGLALVVVGGLVGLVGAVLAMMSRGKQKMVMPAMALLALALILALATPMMFLAAQPGAVKSDGGGVPGSNATSVGPAASFTGSCSGSACGFGAGTSGISESATWGPGSGWYLSIVAFVFFLIAGLFLFMARKASPPPEAAPASAMAGSAMPPPPPAGGM